jgi:hypothetical protein
MARVLNRSVEMHEVRKKIAARFGEAFGAEMIEISTAQFEKELAPG